MAEWQDRANRALTLFEASPDDAGDRTWQIMNHVLGDGNYDDYVSRDFYNVQQTAGGLPDGVSFESFLASVIGRVKSELSGDGFSEDLGDDDFKTAAVTFDASIRQHIAFLNGVVHQAAPGEVHLNLWNYILAARGNDLSIYALYRDYLVDA